MSFSIICQLNRTSYNNLDSLKVALVKSWDEISQEELRLMIPIRYVLLYKQHSFIQQNPFIAHLNVNWYTFS
uniref:Uncharacterized protein n=1 Tax=Heterorhabditis bacteriophora TaxID=37862 RepID=A0A1I7WH22_HETBA